MTAHDRWFLDSPNLTERARLALTLPLGPERREAARTLTDDDIASSGTLVRPGLVAIRMQALASDPYVWIDPYTGERA